jgi:hypothetical protein
LYTKQRKERRRPEAQGIPAFGTREDERPPGEERPHHFVVGRRHCPEPPPARVREQAAGQRHELPVANEALRQARGVSPPGGEIVRPVDAAGAKPGMGDGGHVVLRFPNNTYDSGRLSVNRRVD